MAQYPTSSASGLIPLIFMVDWGFGTWGNVVRVVPQEYFTQERPRGGRGHA